MHPKFLRALHIFRNNRGLKYVSLILAIAAWYVIREVTSFETLIKDVKLDIKVEEGWAVLDSSAGDVDILFRGAQEDLRYLNRDQIFVTVDLKNKSHAGSLMVQLKPGYVRSPGGARAVNINPDEIILSLDREVDKHVPVRADIIGAPPDGYEVEKVSCTPATALIHGPEGRLASIDVIRTEPIDLAGRIRSFQLDKIITQPGETWSARLEPDRVKVEVNIVERSARKEFEEMRICALLPPHARYAAFFRPASVKIVLSGRSDLLAKLEKENISAFVDCSLLDSGKRLELPVRLHVPSGVDIVSIEPELVTAEVEMLPR